MSENKSQGGAGASLGAHSKDSQQGTGQHGGSSGSHTSSTSSMSGQHGGSSGGMAGQATQDRSTQDRKADAQGGSWQQTGAELAGQAREGLEHAASSVRDAAASARDTIATRGSQAMESTGQMVREQPFTALAVTGIACFAIGMMIGRGRY